MKCLRSPSDFPRILGCGSMAKKHSCPHTEVPRLSHYKTVKHGRTLWNWENTSLYNIIGQYNSFLTSIGILYQTFSIGMLRTGWYDYYCFCKVNNLQLYTILCMIHTGKFKCYHNCCFLCRSSCSFISSCLDFFISISNCNYNCFVFSSSICVGIGSYNPQSKRFIECGWWRLSVLYLFLILVQIDGIFLSSFSLFSRFLINNYEFIYFWWCNYN